MAAVYYSGSLAVGVPLCFIYELKQGVFSVLLRCDSLVPSFVLAVSQVAGFLRIFIGCSTEKDLHVCTRRNS